MPDLPPVSVSTGQVQPVPTSTTPLLKIVRTEGWSVQEAWGRWTLSNHSEVRLRSAADQEVILNYLGSLAQPDQQLTVWLDNEQLARYAYKNRGGVSPFGQRLRLHLRRGDHRLILRLNTSNRTGTTPFAPDDPRDLGVALTTLTLASPGDREATLAPTDLLTGHSGTTGQFFTGSQRTYLAVGADGLRTTFRGEGPLQLRYGLVPTRAKQAFRFVLDGQDVGQVFAKAGQVVLRGQLPLPAVAPGRVHTLQVVSGGGVRLHTTPYFLDGSAVLENQVAFYTDRLSVVPAPGKGAVWPPVLAAILSLLSLVGLRQLLFGTDKGKG